MSGLSTLYGGATTAVIETVRELQRHGISAEIATTDADVHGNLDVPLNQLIEKDGVPTRFFHAPVLQKYGVSPGFTGWLNQHIDEYEIVHIHAFFSYVMLATLWCQMKHIPYVVSPLGQLDTWTYGHHAWKKRPFFWLMGRFLLQGATAIHATSQKEYAGVKHLGFGNKCVIIPLGVDLPVNTAQPLGTGTPDSIPNILFLSRIDPKKGLPLLIKAADLLRARGVTFSLTIAGSGDVPHEKEIKALVEHLNLQTIVHFVGFVSGLEKEKYFTRAQIFVLPSYDENFGIAVAEAMAYGLPVVVSEGVALAKEVQEAEAGLVTPVNVIEPLVDALYHLLTNPILRDEMGKRGRLITQQRFAWHSVGKQLITLYTNMQCNTVPAKPLQTT